MQRQPTTCLFLVFLVGLVQSSSANELVRTIRVSGMGKASVTPDMATIHTGIVTHAPTANQALASNNQAMHRIMDALKNHGVDSKDVQTSSFNVHPDYNRDRRGQTQPEIIGYQVSNQVRVRVRKIADLGRVLDSLVQAGSNQVSGISFGIDDPTSVLDQARNRGMADARRRAELYAKAAGVRVGKVMSISEQSVQLPQPRMMVQDVAFERAAAVPVAAGQQEIQATIHVVYAMQDAE